MEVVTITAAALKEDIYITGIELPGGDYIEGSRAEYKAAAKIFLSWTATDNKGKEEQ